MSDIRQILAHVTDSPHSSEVLRLAAELAADHGARVGALYAVEPPTTGAYVSPEASAIATQLMLEAEQARRNTATALLIEASRTAGVEIPLAMATGDPLSALNRAARTTDLLVLGQHDSRQPDGVGAGLAARLLVGAGCPLLFVPHIDWRAALASPRKGCGQHVLVAWSGTRESARALRDALPLLRRAQRVEIVSFVQGAAQAEADEALALDAVAEHLRRHGVTAESTVHRSREPSIGERMLRPWTPDAPIAEALLSHAADSDADLIVMGGYGHPRAWELALGGVTRTLLQSMTVPVLMSH